MAATHDLKLIMGAYSPSFKAQADITKEQLQSYYRKGPENKSC